MCSNTLLELQIGKVYLMIVSYLIVLNLVLLKIKVFILITNKQIIKGVTGELWFIYKVK